MTHFAKYILFLVVYIFCLPAVAQDFVKVKDTHFEIGGKCYFFLGTNFWYGLNLGSKGPGGDRARLLRELDRLQAMGVTNLRIMAGSEGPDTEPYRMVPALQTAPGIYNEAVADGLDFLLAEMAKRKMLAVVCLADFWNWSGGMGQYIVWSNAAKNIPYPPPHPGGDWGVYQDFVSGFYNNQKAVNMLNNHIRFVVQRKNTYTGVTYRDDPTIMAWELANEPRGAKHTDAYRQWIRATAALIKKIDANHLVTTGSEGATSSPTSGTDPKADHADKNIDYQTIHIWVQNWQLYDPHNAVNTYQRSVHYMQDYIRKHEQISRELGKPLVLEEFGISRDQDNHDATSPVTMRDAYYKDVFETVFVAAAGKASVVSGVNFWAWGGEGRPSQPKSIWKPGDNFVGDPPHEFQGWYSVYQTDSSTNTIIKRYAEKMHGLGK